MNARSLLNAWPKYRLDLSLRLLGRWARYTLNARVQLPASCLRKPERKPLPSFGVLGPTRGIPVIYEPPRSSQLIVIEPYTFKPDRGTVQQQVFWDGRPNHSMIPANFAARRIRAAFEVVFGTHMPVPASPCAWNRDLRPYRHVSGRCLYDHPASRRAEGNRS